MKSRKPASLEAWLEVFRLERPKGVGGGAPLAPSFFIFSGSVSESLSEKLFHDFGAQNGRRNWFKIGSKISSFFGLPPKSFFLAFRAALGRFFEPSGPLGDLLGGVKSEKMLTVLCENHFFENSLFRFLELYSALLGSS